MLVPVLLRGARPESRKVIDGKLGAVGFGCLVPVFFISTGISSDLDALTAPATTLALVPLLLLLFLPVRGIPATLAAPPGSSVDDKLAIAPARPVRRPSWLSRPSRSTTGR